MDAPAVVLQRECGHTVLCENCAFRVYSTSSSRFCTVCRAPALLPFVMARGYTKRCVDKTTASNAISFARVTIFHNSHIGVLDQFDPMVRSLEGIVDIIPEESAKDWFSVTWMACEMSNPKIDMSDTIIRISNVRTSENFARGIIYASRWYAALTRIIPLLVLHIT